MNEASAVASKVCTACGARYPGDALFCPSDGSPLQSASSANGHDAEDDPYLGLELSGHIEVRQLVGIGAMGRVYRAFQKGIDRDVAVKILHRELSANAQLVSRFTREAKVASRLSHPNVVQVLLAGQLHDRSLYMVMEYLDGLSLQSALAAVGGSLPLSRALHIGLQLCEAGGEAHAQGIVHRDLKPENVMLVRRGADHDFVKVLDFGIARLDWGEQSVATAAGLIFGTARYISPEGAQGNAVGPASDVYAIATLFYQMLSGRTPFEGEQAVGLLVQQIHDVPPPLRSIPRAAYVPQSIADVIMANLAKDPKAREPDARAFGHAIIDAAKQAGLAPDDISRPILHRTPSVMQLPPTERTSPLDLTPELLDRMNPSRASGTHAPAPGARATGMLTAATAKWEPPSEFQARLAALSDAAREESAAGAAGANGARGARDSRESFEPPVRRRTSSGVDATLDDASGEPPYVLPSITHVEEPRPGTFPPTAPSRAHPIPRTIPGDVPSDAYLAGPTRYGAPAPSATPPPAASSRISSTSELPPSTSRSASLVEAPRRSRGILFVLLCFVLGAAGAAGFAWKMGKIGGDDGEDRFVARATDAMFKNRFVDPPGENVRDITNEGLRRWPNAPRLIDVRVRAADGLVGQAVAQRSAGDVAEALRLAKTAQELDPNDAAAKRLVDQYEGELANFSASTTSPLPKAPTPPASQVVGKPAVPVATGYKVILDVSVSSPRTGQTVDLVARIAPSKGTFDEPAFVVSGPGVPGGVRLPAQSSQAGVFKASFAFLEGGKFEVVFSTQAEGKALRAARPVVVADSGRPRPPPQPSSTPSSAPAAPSATTPVPTPSVKWM